ncbi:uncharacterized protein LOC143920165 isoform X2 [Arctopsyche grandis]|uniref:uncharacterized protein LOC143920165 isoform X2 n=1 Tax=Arctopsyche grandis TaxID=121162 RepID=UPI00406D8B7F
MAQSAPGGRVLTLKQATLPFARAPPKRPRLEEPPTPAEPSPPSLPSPSPPSPPKPVQIEDDESAEEIVCEPTISEKLLNPFVPLVDMMLKRKLMKKIGPNKKPKLQTENNETDLANNDENIDPHSHPNSINNTSMEVDLLDSEDTDVETSDNVVPISDSEDSCSDEGASDVKANNTTSDDTHEHQEQDDENADDSKNDEKHPPTDLLTPKRKSSTQTPSPLSSKKLTPKQLEKKLESAKKQRQREFERQEREKKKQEEKDMKAKLKEEKDAQLKKEKEEREEAKRLALELKESKIKLKQQDKEARELRKIREKEMREEQKKMFEQAKEEERLRKEQEKEKEQIKKNKAAAAFANFFVPKEKVVKKESKEIETLEKFSHNHKFLSNFTIKSDMRLAPTIRHKLTNIIKENLEKLLLKQDTDKNLLYISTIKFDKYEIKSCGKTWPCEEVKNDIVILEDDLPPVDETKDESLIIPDKHEGRALRPKLLSFSENRRPPYWGTWRRKSKQINGRRPFALDTTYLDYTCDSDEEWEEEEPGESVDSIAGSDDEGEGENEYDVDNDFMVPHGYLSDEEALGEDDNALSPEALKAKLQYLEHEFEDEMKKPTKVKKPRLLGIVWQNRDGGKPDTCADAVWNFLTQKSVLSLEELDLEDGEKSAAKKKKKLSDDMIPDLVKLVHGNTNNRGFLAKEFQTYIAKTTAVTTEPKSEEENLEHKQISHGEISKISILKKIREISTWMPCPDEGVMHSKMCWFVEKEVRDKYDLGDLQLPNEWSYTLMPKRRADIIKRDKPTPKQSPENKSFSKESPPPKKENNFNITKFTKKMTQEEREKQFSSSNVTNEDKDSTIVTTVQNKVQSEKKRVSLMFLGPMDKATKSSQSPSIIQKKCEVDLKDTTPQPPSAPSVSKVENKKRVVLTSSAPPKPDTPKPVRTNLLTQFIKTAAVKYSKTSEDLEKQDECVVLSD